MKIFKFFPVALAALALASCSNDDFISEGVDYQLKSNEMLVTVEDLGDSQTRAGIVEGQYEKTPGNYAISKILVFNPGDVLKVYDEVNSWKPQTWKLKKVSGADKDVHYTLGNGVAGGDAAIFENTVAGGGEYSNGYGIFPATFKKGAADVKFGQFSDEDRTTMTFDFDAFKVMNNVTVNKALSLEADAKVQAKFATNKNFMFPIPMWGITKTVGANKTMQLKYLTAFLRIDITNVAAKHATEANKEWSKYLLIRSDNVLTGKFTATIADPEADLPTKAPVLVPAEGNNMPVAPAAGEDGNDLAAYPMTGAIATANTDILVKLGNVEGDIVVYVPIYAGENEETSTVNHNFSIYLSDNTQCAGAGAVTTINFGTSPNVLHKGNAAIAKTKVGRGETYNVIDDSRKANTTATSPYEMVKAILDEDAKATRDFEITFTTPIKVRNEDTTPQNQWIDFEGFDGYGFTNASPLKHNVKVNVTFNNNNTGGTESFLKINKIGGKKLTLNINSASTNEKIIVTDQMASLLEITGKVNKLENNSTAQYNASTGKITKGLLLKAPATSSVITTGAMDIDIPYNTTDNIKLLTLAKGIQKINILNGYVEKLNTAAGDDKITKNTVTINTTGESSIKEIDYTNVPAATAAPKNFTKELEFKTVWSGDKQSTFEATKITGALSANGGAAITDGIVTAAQLAALPSGTTATLLAKEFDLNGSNETWTPVSQLSGNLSGNFFVYPAAGTTDATKQATIKDMKVEATAAGQDLGLFSNVGAAGVTVKNLIISNTTINAASGMIPASAGVFAAKSTNAVAFENVDITGATITTAGMSQNLGGLIGILSGATNYSFADVTTTNVAITGYKNMGGIIGNVAKAVLNVTFSAQTSAITPANCKVESFTFTQNLNTNDALIQGDVAYARNGKFIGSIEVDNTNKPTVTINVNDAPAAPASYHAKAKIGKQNDGVFMFYPLKAQQDLVGFSGLNSTGAAFAYDAGSQDAWSVTVKYFNTATTANLYDYTTVTFKPKNTKLASPNPEINMLWYIEEQ